MKVTVKNTTTVWPAVDETPHHVLFNSNLDLMMPSIHTPMLYFYRHDGSHNFFDIKTLKESLSKVLAPFYPLAGRFKIGENGRIETACPCDGVPLVEAVADTRLDDLGEFAPNSEFMQLVPLVEQTMGISSYPLIALQVTYFACGGVCVGVGIHHYLADAFSIAHFTNSWSQLARGMGTITSPPFFDRTLLRARNPPRPTFNHSEYKSQPQLKTSLGGITTGNVKTAPPIGAIFKLTQDQVARLERKAKEGNHNNVVNYSTAEIVMAHLWRCVSKARGLDPDQETMLYIPMDGRNRLRPPLPSGYFGNVVFCGAPRMKSGEVSSSTYQALCNIHDTLAKMDDEYFRSAIDLLEMIPDLPSLFLKAQSFFVFPSVLINSYLKVPLHEADFGWGKPVFVGQANITNDGLVFMLPGPSGDSSVSVALGLQPHHMIEFGKLIHDI